MHEEAFLNELDRQFETNIQAISNAANILVTAGKSPSGIVQFFTWFSRWSNKTINGQGNPGYPQWLTQLGQLSKQLKKSSYFHDPLAKAAILVDDLIQDISYCGTEEQHVEKTRDILRLLRSISAGTDQELR